MTIFKPHRTMMNRMAVRFTMLRSMAFGVIALASWPTTATAAINEEAILTCRIEGQGREASVSLSGTRATYRYGVPQQQPELILSSELADLDYRRGDGAGDTFDEIVTFANGNTAYRFAAGFRNGAEPDPSALRPFGLLTVMRNGKILAELKCEPSSIERVPDRLLANMREIGREGTSDGVPFPNYPIHAPVRAAQSPPCEADFNVDTCWSRGVSASRSGDLRAALEHYDMSCAARIGTMGCYEAGKLNLHNWQLRNYDQARLKFSRTCDGDDPGQGPYACKYLGWMYLTGTGVQRNLGEAFGLLAQACFLHNDAILIDPEGCHFLAKAALERAGHSARDKAQANYLAYLSLAQACTDDAKTVCDEARALYQGEAKRRADWITRCDREVGHSGVITSCARLTTSWDSYDSAQAARHQLATLFRGVSTSME